MLQKPRFLYLHGFASGPESYKGRELAAHLAQRGILLERLNLRLPSFERLRVSAMLEEVQRSMAGPAERVVLFGSSLGGFVAAQMAAQDPRVAAVFLMAPAFGLIERWRARLGEAGWLKWQQSGWLETRDYTTGEMARVDFGFIEDLRALAAQRSELPDVRVPTLILHGRKDDAVDIATSRSFVQGHAHMRLIELEDGHELRDSLPRIKSEADAFLQPFCGPLSQPSSAERRAYSVAVYPRHAGRLLLIRHRRLGVWLPPGGECLFGERPSDAAVRELYEETGLSGVFPKTSDIDGTPPGLIGYEEHRAGSKGLHMNFVFVADVPTEEIRPNNEFEEWRWVTLEDAAFADAPPNVKQLAILALRPELPAPQ